MKEVKSPLRYPGGKSKAIGLIRQCFPTEFSEFREPFIGGGSVFLHVKQNYPIRKFWINDLNSDLICFWKAVQQEINELVEAIWQIKQITKDGRELFDKLVVQNGSELSEFDRAVRFFVLNRITFSGTVECGGFSIQAFQKRFTDSSIQRLHLLKGLLDSVLITNFDYQEVLAKPGENVFIFLDPPYFTATKSKLYGKKGDLHLGFNHAEFAQALKNCPHRWLITYDDSPEIRQNFDFAYVYEWELQYGMNNYKQTNAAKGKELLIANYEVSLQFIQPGVLLPHLADLNLSPSRPSRD